MQGCLCAVREMVGCFRKEELDDYIDRNKIHVFDMRFLPTEVRERFQGDIAGDSGLSFGQGKSAAPEAETEKSRGSDADVICTVEG